MGQRVKIPPPQFHFKSFIFPLPQRGEKGFPSSSPASFTNHSWMPWYPIYRSYKSEKFSFSWYERITRLVCLSVGIWWAKWTETCQSWLIVSKILFKTRFFCICNSQRNVFSKPEFYFSTCAQLPFRFTIMCSVYEKSQQFGSLAHTIFRSALSAGQKWGDTLKLIIFFKYPFL